MIAFDATFFLKLWNDENTFINDILLKPKNDNKPSTILLDFSWNWIKTGAFHHVSHISSSFITCGHLPSINLSSYHWIKCLPTQQPLKKILHFLKATTIFLIIHLQLYDLSLGRKRSSNRLLCNIEKKMRGDEPGMVKRGGGTDLRFSQPSIACLSDSL